MTKSPTARVFASGGVDDLDAAGAAGRHVDALQAPRRPGDDPELRQRASREAFTFV